LWVHFVVGYVNLTKIG